MEPVREGELGTGTSSFLQTLGQDFLLLWKYLCESVFQSTSHLCLLLASKESPNFQF